VVVVACNAESRWKRRHPESRCLGSKNRGNSDDGRVAGHPRRMKMGSAAALRSAKLGTGESEDGVAPGALRDSELCRERVDQTLD
jgi:hypothetical protein